MRCQGFYRAEAPPTGWYGQTPTAKHLGRWAQCELEDHSALVPCGPKTVAEK